MSNQDPPLLEGARQAIETLFGESIRKLKK